jgi:uncharacterized YigZ family protein
VAAYRTLAAAARAEIEPIERSRFLADAAPVADAEAALALVERVRAEFPDATHHCFAYRLPPAGVEYRASDAGEPRGSAGVPILKRIEGAGLVGVAVVVTRWFGGVKLGVGGLMRAYGAAAAAALAKGGAVEVAPSSPWVVRYPYECERGVQALLASPSWPSAWLRGGAEYGAEIALAFAVPEGDEEPFAARFADATAGRARVEPG